MSNLNFESILKAIDIMLNKKLESFPYSSQGVGTIVEKLGSNRYRVNYNGGEIEAVDLNANGEHEAEERVHLLIANAEGTSYILGTESAGTDEDIAAMFKTLSFEFLTENLLGEEEKSAKLENNSNIVEILSQDLTSAENTFNTTKSFILYAKIKTNDIAYNLNGKYYFRITYDKSLTTILDNSMMIGSPYKFYSPTTQTLYFNPPEAATKITKIEFVAEGISFKNADSYIEATEIGLYGAPDKSNFIDSEVKVSFKNANQSAFTTVCSQVTLQAELEYNGKRFLPLGMEFFWERLDTPTLQGQIWASLNQSVEKKLGDNTYTELIGRVSNEIVMEKTSAIYFENYYRCKVKYLGNTKISEPFKVINYEKPDFLVSYSFENKKDTLFASSDSITVNIAANFLKGHGVYSFQYSWYKKDGESYTPLSGETNSSLTISYNSEMPIGENVYKCIVQAIYDGVSVGGKEVEIKFYNYVLGEDEKDLVTEITETIYYNNDTATLSIKPNFQYYTPNDKWSFKKPSGSDTKFLFASTRRVLTTSNSGKGYTWTGYYPANESVIEQKYIAVTDSETNITYFKQTDKTDGNIYIKNPNLTNIPTEWSEPKCIEVGGGSAALAEQINIFNQLTQNGTQDGFFFNESGNIYVPSKDTSNKGKTYYSFDGYDESGNEIYNQVTNFISGKPYYEKVVGNSNLYINSTYLRTKTLDIPGKLFASVERNQVTIGGFEVDNNSLYSNYDKVSNTGIMLSNGLDNNKPYFLFSPNFKLLNSGDIKINSENLFLYGDFTLSEIDMEGMNYNFIRNSNFKTFSTFSQYLSVDDGILTCDAPSSLSSVTDQYTMYFSSGFQEYLTSNSDSDKETAEVTLSFEYKINPEKKNENTTAKIKVVFNGTSGGAIIASPPTSILYKYNMIQDGYWHIFQNTISINTADKFNSCSLEFATIKNISIKNLKLEKGKTKTNWCLAREEISSFRIYDGGKIQGSKGNLEIDLEGKMLIKSIYVGDDKIKILSFVKSSSNKGVIAFGKYDPEKNADEQSNCYWLDSQGINLSDDITDFRIDNVFFQRNKTYSLQHIYTTTKPFSIYQLSGSTLKTGLTFDYNDSNFQRIVACSGSFIKDNKYLYASSGSSGWTIGTTDNRWKTGYFNDIVTDSSDSDARCKNSIETFPLQYEEFFDKMNPVRYKYNEGTSGRYHTGYIAQELVQSLEECNLTTKDFAGVVLDHPGEEIERWYLRRDEFVALNTWQIQKLKKKIKALEEKIDLLSSNS